MSTASPEDSAPVHSFTRDWWERLPRIYRAADREQTPPVPMLRFMDGPGRLAGTVRDLNTAMYDGQIMDPDTTPERLLPWVAFLVGIGEGPRRQRPDLLRARLHAQVTGRQNGVGTRQHIADAARAYLEPGARVQVIASDTLPMTLIVGVAGDDVPDEDYDRFRRLLRGAGVVPAGHALRVWDIRTTWDAWEATAGETWEQKEANIRTWTDSDQAGVIFD